MPTPAPRPYEDPLEDLDHGWPQPPELRRPVPVQRATPAQRPLPVPRRRSRFGGMWLVLALLGVVLAAVAGLWYLRLERNAPPSQLTVPRVVGLKEGVAIQQLRTLGLAVRSVEMPASGKVGIVFRQRPAAGATLARGRSVTIDVASGK